jgi:hypothetical protein
MPVILATQEAEIRFKASMAKKFERPYLENTQHIKKGWWRS